MKTGKASPRIVPFFVAGYLAVVGPAVSAWAQDVPPPPPAGDSGVAAGPALAPAAADPNVEVLTRGPVHEAYASPTTGGQPAAGLTVQKQPPAAVDEIPPDMKPESDKAVWIPGYWSWDDDRKDFIWVSGVWRVPPPGFRWMPGYWQNNQGQGYQWISGYWMPAHLQETTFMPQPPASLDSGPTSAQPDPGHFWVAGHWQWYEGRYVWQPGYWAVCQPDWIWVPATYYWCPSGWVYVPGYWDYPLARRGLVFSPVYFAGPVVAYRPAVCLDVGVLSFSLFCRPAYCHYYFGDYYDDHYVAIGIRPWFYHGPHWGPDPLFGYYRWYHEDHLGEHEWGNHLAGWHEYYRTHPDMRPPHTLAEQRRLEVSGALRSRPDAHQLYMAHDVHQIDAHAAGAMRLQQVSAAQHAQLTHAARETANFQQERQHLEHTSAAGVSGPSQPSRVNLASMPSFKSSNLPGASAANVQASASRISSATGAAGVPGAGGASGAGSGAGRGISGSGGNASLAVGRGVTPGGGQPGQPGASTSAAGGRVGAQVTNGATRGSSATSRDTRNKNDKDKPHN